MVDPAQEFSFFRALREYTALRRYRCPSDLGQGGLRHYLDPPRRPESVVVRQDAHGESCAGARVLDEPGLLSLLTALKNLERHYGHFQRLNSTVSASESTVKAALPELQTGSLKPIAPTVASFGSCSALPSDRCPDPYENGVLPPSRRKFFQFETTRAHFVLFLQNRRLSDKDSQRC